MREYVCASVYVCVRLHVVVGVGVFYMSEVLSLVSCCNGLFIGIGICTCEV